MLIGLTYDLRQDYLDAGYGEEETAEFDRPDTIDAIENTLRELGHETDRIGRITSLIERLSRGDRWDLVFNIAEGLHGIGREAQVPALLDAYEIPYTYSDPLVCALSLHKPMTKRIVRDLGLPTPGFAAVEKMGDLDAIDLQFPLFAKPIAEGTSKGVTSASKIANQKELREVCAKLLAQFKQPVLVEEFLPGREFTVGIVGTGEDASVVAVMEVILLANAEAEVYTYLNKEQCEERVQYTLAPLTSEIAKEASQLALAVWHGMGCRDGGRVDVRQDHTGKLSFIEVNPLPGIHPQHSDLPIMATLAGWTYRQLIERIVNSALKRLNSNSNSNRMTGAVR
jgi:D-alanine-D-alanine ligase